MLLRVTVENFLSFRDEINLSMIASSDDRHLSHVLTSPTGKARVLRGAAIYGANGHGKTNLIHALIFVRDLVLKGSEVDRPVPVRKFKSSPSMNDAPATFIFNIVKDNIEYEYGIKVNDDFISEEWLYSSPNGREVVLFERVTRQKEKASSYETEVIPGPSLLKSMKGSAKKEFFKFVAQGTRPNQPFLTESIQRNIEALRPIYNWFRRDLRVISAEVRFNDLEMRAHNDAEFINRLSEAVRAAGIGIDRLETEARPIEIENFRSIPTKVLRDIQETLEPDALILVDGLDDNRTIIRKNASGDLEVIDIIFVHKRDDGNEVKFTLSEESAGTRRLLHLFPILFDLEKSGKTYFVDELDRKLHPILAYNLLRSFLFEKNCGQLIFTTHNTQLLDLELIRRDEIWFVEKSSDGHSEVYSLADLKVRADVEIRRGYLQGRFGAIPFLGSVGSLGWGKKENGRTHDSKEASPRQD